MCYIWRGMGVRKVGFKQQKWPSESLKVILLVLFDRPHMISYKSSVITYVSLLYHFWDLVSYFTKIRGHMTRNTSPSGGSLSCRLSCMCYYLSTSLCTPKFEMTSFIHSKDMMGTQNLKMSHVTMTMILSGVLVVGWDLLWSTYVPNLKLLSPPVTKIRWRDTVEIEMVVRVTEIDWKKVFTISMKFSM